MWGHPDGLSIVAGLVGPSPIGFGFDPLAQLCHRRARGNVRKADPSSLVACEHCGEGLEVKNLEATACVLRQTGISQE